MKTPGKLAQGVEQLKRGDKEAFASVYEDSYGYLHTCVIHIVKDEDIAQDMLQDTYSEIYRNISQLKSSEDFLSWAATIANRKCFAYIKKDREILVDNKTDDEGNESSFFDSVSDDEAFIPENILDNREKIKMIRDIIDDLSDIQRACIIGFYYNEQKQEEIAEQLGIPVNTVKSHLNRAKAKIKTAVGDIEKKQDVKLYSFAPFMLLLFREEVVEFTSCSVIPAYGVSVGTSALSGAETVAGSVGKKVVSFAIKKKIIAGFSAFIIGGGTIAGTVIYQQNHTQESEPVKEVLVDEQSTETPSNEPQNTEVEEQDENYIDVYISLDDILASIYLYGKSLSDADREWYTEMAGSSLPDSEGDENPHSIGDGLNMTWWKNNNFNVEGVGYGDEDVSDRIFGSNMSIKDVLDSFHPEMYDKLLKYGNIDFQNGTASFSFSDGTGIRSYAFKFDEEDKGGKGFNSFMVSAFYDNVICAYAFLNMDKMKDGTPLAGYDQAYIDEMDEKSMKYYKQQFKDKGGSSETEENTEEAVEEEPEETEDKEKEPSDDIISGSYDLDPVIDKYTNASKISELNEIVAAGTKVYSSSGKTMIVYYNMESGDFLGYDPAPATEINVGKTEVSADSDSEINVIRNTAKWRMNVYRCTDGDGDLYVDFYAVP